MLTHLRRAVVVSIVLFVLCGLAYPAFETGVAQLLFPHQANGSLTRNGSTLAGQAFSAPRWFTGRPEPVGASPDASGAANLGPRSSLLLKDVRRTAAQLRRAGITPTNDLVTTSGSGFDPDISPADAAAEAPAVARANHLSLAAVRRIIAQNTTGRELGFLGSPRVNVLRLNEALARLEHRPR